MLSDIEEPAVGDAVFDVGCRLAAERAPKLRIAPDLTTALVMHLWPLNVRELEHVLSVAIVTSTEDLLRIEHVGESLRTARTSAPPHAHAHAHARASAPPPAVRALGEEEERLRAELSAELHRTRGNVSEVARTMGKTRMQIHRWMKRFGIAPDSFRP